MATDPFPQLVTDVREIRSEVEKLDHRVEKLDHRVEKLDHRVEKLDHRVEKLELHAEKTNIDIQQIQQTLLRHDARFDALEQKVDRGFTEMRDGLAEIRSITKGLTGAITEAVTQLAVSRSFEKRLDRLETEVFGAKP